MDKVFQTVRIQLKNVFGLQRQEEDLLNIKEGGYFVSAYDRAQMCLNHFLPKYYDGKIDPYNSVMYCIFLYWLGHFLYLGGGQTKTESSVALKMANKVYYLNKMLNGNDIFYAIELPKFWCCEHPVGAVLGRADFGNSFYFYQGCTVGGSLHNDKICYPQIGNNVTMFSDSKILGASVIGNNCVLSANTYLINERIPDNSLVFGQSPNIVIKNNVKSQKEWLGL